MSDSVPPAAEQSEAATRRIPERSEGVRRGFRPGFVRERAQRATAAKRGRTGDAVAGAGPRGVASHDRRHPATTLTSRGALVPLSHIKVRDGRLATTVDASAAAGSERRRRERADRRSRAFHSREPTGTRRVPVTNPRAQRGGEAGVWSFQNRGRFWKPVRRVASHNAAFASEATKPPSAAKGGRAGDAAALLAESGVEHPRVRPKAERAAAPNPRAQRGGEARF